MLGSNPKARHFVYDERRHLRCAGRQPAGTSKHWHDVLELVSGLGRWVLLDPLGFKAKRMVTIFPGLVPRRQNPHELLFKVVEIDGLGPKQEHQSVTLCNFSSCT